MPPVSPVAQLAGRKIACLCDFNAARADPAAWLGERPGPETHLIPIAREVALGQRGPVSVFGDYYDTLAHLWLAPSSADRRATATVM